MGLIALPKEQPVLPEEQIEDATKEGNKVYTFKAVEADSKIAETTRTVKL